MEVRLLSYTPDGEKVVAAAARLCYSAKSAVNIMDDFSADEANSFLDRLLELGHSSPLEHASFTFAIDGVSRVLSHQLVRHRIGASFSQKSQRYVRE
ncbi:MAG: FAD-dependent thymidylate synthase, partial [Clostridiales bacterium]